MKILGKNDFMIIESNDEDAQQFIVDYLLSCRIVESYPGEAMVFSFEHDDGTKADYKVTCIESQNRIQ
jgi:hypothetical protein